MIPVDPLHAWINQVFDHPESNPPWYHAEDAPEGDAWKETPEEIALHITETFENADYLLSRFSDGQLNQGFWYLFDTWNPDFMGTLLDEGVSQETRLRALRSFIPLFEQVMAVRCSSHLSHLDEQGENPLNAACYMWFDELLDLFQPERLEQAKLSEELLRTLRDILAIPHDAWRESALHGIGHWVEHYSRLAATVDDFLAATPGLRPKLVAWAMRARAGQVL